MPHPAGPIRDSGLLLARNAVGYSAYSRSHGMTSLFATVPEFFGYFLPNKCCGPDYKVRGGGVAAVLQYQPPAARLPALRYRRCLCIR